MKKRKVVKSEIIIETGFVCDAHGNKHIVYLTKAGDILTTTSGRGEGAFEAAALLFYRDIADKVAIHGDFIQYGSGDYPVSYEHKVCTHNDFRRTVFEARLSILTKENYETILESCENS